MWRTRSSAHVLNKSCWLLAALVLFASFLVNVGAASAMTEPLIRTQHYETDDLDGTVEVVFRLEPGADPVLGMQFSITYDPSAVAPALFTDPNIGLVGAPACASLSSNSAVTCGPLMPTGQMAVSIFRSSGAWASATDVVSIPFVALGSAAHSPLEISGASVATTEVLDASTESGSITIGSPPATPTPSATPVPTPTVTNLPGGAEVRPDNASLVAPAAVTLNVLANDSHTGSVATITVGSASQGTVRVNGDLSLTYSPGVSSSTTDSFTYTACDQAQCGQTTVTVNITPPSCDGVLASLWGTAGNDSLVGSVGSDVIVGFGGDDDISAGDGDDLICSGDGKDVASGGAGDDRIFGGAHDDVLRGGPGEDYIIGSFGNDRLLGGIGDDVIDGGAGDDYLGGFGGDDVLEGGSGDEIIYGGFGADKINAGPGDDRVFGLVGDDEIDGGSGADLLKGNRGNDTVVGGPGDDVLQGGNADDALDGGDGDDRISGGKADDTITGGTGIDTCTGNAHNVADTATASCETVASIP